MKKNKESASLFAVVVIVGLFVMAGTAITGALTNAQWKGSAASTYEAVGTVLEKESEITPAHSKGINSQYLRVVFKSDEGKIFVIPFRASDMEAIPVNSPGKDVPAHDETSGYQVWSCSGNTTCQTSPVTISHVPAHHEAGINGHGVLAYHNCEGDFHCFDYFKEMPAPKAK